IAVLETARAGSEVTPPSEVFIELLDSLLIDNPFSSILVQVWAEASFDEEVAGFAATIFESLAEEFTVYLASYLHEARAAGLESARAPAEELVPAILAMIPGAAGPAGILVDRSRQRLCASTEGLLSRIDY